MNKHTLHQTFTALLLLTGSIHGKAISSEDGSFATAFYTPGMGAAEKARVDRVLSVVPQDQREAFISLFQAENKTYSSSFFCDGILSALVKLDPSDWGGFAKFAHELLSTTLRYSDGFDEHLYGAAFARIITNAVHVAPSDRSAFKRLVKNYINPKYSIEENSWVIVGASKVPSSRYDRVAELMEDLSGPAMSPYEYSLLLAALGKIKQGDVDALSNAKYYFTGDLSVEHKASIIEVLAAMASKERYSLFGLVKEYSSKKDGNYRAWLIQALSIVPEKWRAEAAFEISKYQDVSSSDFLSKMAVFVQKKRNEEAEALAQIRQGEERTKGFGRTKKL